MKGDFSRDTFDPTKHYAGVRMQQGRVQIDADWNEQADIVEYRADATARDVVGDCGAPVRNAGFRLVSGPNELTTDEKELPGNETPWLAPADSRDFYITAGRLYVDGILVENERAIRYLDQGLRGGDLPNPAALPDGVSLAYLDVWQRHLTALEDPRIREIALGGPDTATRVKTVWQVRWFQDGGATDCDAYFQRLLQSLAQRTGKLAARAEPPAESQEPCVIPPSAGYRGLENQLYRVEVHQGGAATNLSALPAAIDVTGLPQRDQIRVVSTAISQNDLIEVFRSAGDAASKPMSGILVQVTDVDVVQPQAMEAILTLDRELEGLSLDDSPKVRARGAADAWFKWSRDNGFVVTKITKIAGNEITVDSLGPDDVLGFRVGDWVEITDDAAELNAAQPNATPAQIAQIKDVNETTNVITVRVPVNALGAADGVDPDRHPKLRRWDGIAAVKRNPPAGEDFQELENGVQVRFHGGHYVPGDYWLVPARTATAEADSGNALWPRDDNGVPVLLPPEGIDHHYCPLGVITVAPNSAAASEITAIEDCRELFPPLSSMTNLLYVGGDGQTGTPGQPATPDPDDNPLLINKPALQVRVVNGALPVVGARVRFTIPPGGGSGTLANTTVQTFEDTTDVDGLASCTWLLDDANLHQLCEARLLDGASHPVDHQVVRFNATLNRASEVSFTPPADCPPLTGRATVQEALEALCEQGHGEGCCIIVGKGGMAADLAEAVAIARRREWRSVCFCLLPGEHPLPALKLTRDLFENVTISGLKSGSQLLVAERPIIVEGLASFTFREVEIAGRGGLSGLLDIAETGWLTIDKCRLVNPQAPTATATLRVADCGQLTIVDSVIEGAAGFDLPARLPREVAGLISAAQRPGTRLTGGMLQAQMERWRRGPEAVADDLRRAIDDNPDALSDEERELLKRLADLIAERDASGLLGLLPRVVEIVARASPVAGTAIQLSDGRSRAWLERNTIRGSVTLYGDPRTEDTELGLAAAARILELVKDRPVSAPQGGQLHLAGNLLHQVVFGEEWLKSAGQLFDGADFARLFRGITASGNVFQSFENEFMAGTVALASNTFQQGSNEYDGIVVASSATFTGNIAEMPTRLVAAATEFEEAANLRMTF